MKKSQLDLSRTKKTLMRYRENGKHEVIWSLKPEYAVYLAKFYQVTPYLYTMRTRKFPNIRYIKHQLLKDLHYQYKRGKQSITRKLTTEEQNLLKDHGISFRVVKYRIVLG